MFRIQIINKLDAQGLQVFSPKRYLLGNHKDDVHGILLRSHRLGEDDLSPGLRAIARAGAGVNNIPVSACTRRGIVVFNTPGANANSVKELVLGALLNSSRSISEGIRFVHELHGAQDPDALHGLVEEQKKRFTGQEISGRTLGVIGLGHVGSLVANACLQLDMRVLGHDPELSVDAAWRLSHAVEKQESLAGLLAQSDYVTLHTPLVEATRHLINRDNIGTFKPGAILLNYARAEIVDSNAIAIALDSGRLRRYCSDFPQPGLVGRDDCLLTPHLGASTTEAERNCAMMAARQMADFFERGHIINSVNFPNLSLEYDNSHRIVVINRNVPSILGQILSLLARYRINVADMVNKSRGDMACNLIDPDTEIPDEGLQQIAEIENVLQVYRIERT